MKRKSFKKSFERSPFIFGLLDIIKISLFLTINIILIFLEKVPFFIIYYSLIKIKIIYEYTIFIFSIFVK